MESWLQGDALRGLLTTEDGATRAGSTVQ
jgi:hypothetical protein